LDHRQIEADSPFLFYSDNAIRKMLAHCTISDDYLYSILKRRFSWQQTAKQDLDSLFELEEAPKWDHTIEQDTLVSDLIDYVTQHRAPASDEVWDLLVSILVFTQSPYLNIAARLPRAVLNPDMCLCLLRSERGEELDQALQCETITIEESQERLLDRAVIYQQTSAIAAIANTLEDQDLAYFRVLSSLTAEENNPASVTSMSLNLSGDNQDQGITMDTLKSWQKNRSVSGLKEAAQSGYLFLCEEILAKDNPEPKDIDSALVEASEQGYLTIVKLLYHHKGSLSAHGNWPIKYCNRFEYPKLKAFLLEEGVQDARFG
jgi:hypothetical protein